MQNKILKIKLIKSLIGVNRNHKLIIKSLGLRKTNSISILLDNPSTRGMIKKISYLIKLI